MYLYCIVDSIPVSPSLSLSLSLSHSGYRYLFYARTAALLVPADDRATASTFQQNDARYRLDGGLAGYHYIAKAQRHLSRHTSSCASPRWRYRWPIVLSALQSMCITLNVGSLLSTLRNVSRLLSILHPTPPPTAYYLLLDLIGPLVCANNMVWKSCRRQFELGGVSKVSRACLKAVSEPVSKCLKVSQTCLN